MITEQRHDFYLDSDNVCRWKYLGCILTGDGVKHIYDIPKNSIQDVKMLNMLEEIGGRVIDTGVCDICGKTNLQYNFILKYEGSENKKDLAVAGSECIEYLDKADLLRIKMDKKRLDEQHKKENAIIYGEFMEKLVEAHPELQSKYWGYYYNRSLWDSLSYLIRKSKEGIPYYEKPFGKEIKKELLKYGIVIPDMRGIKHA